MEKRIAMWLVIAILAVGTGAYVVWTIEDIELRNKEYRYR